MASRIIGIVFPLVSGTLVAVALSACSSSDNGGGGGGTPDSGAGGGATGGTPSTGGGGGAGGGSAGTGGAGGGSAGTGGGGGDGGLVVDYVCSSAPARDPGGTGTSGASCCGGLGKCADPASVTGPMAKALGHDTCSSSLVCAPPTGGDAGAPKTCTTHVGATDPAGLEGRCLPSCFMLGNPQAITLDDGGGTCASGELCAPCFNPIDGTSTGACNTGTDKPTTTAPAPYKECPAANDAGEPVGGGLCVPSSALTKASDPKSPIYNPAIGGLKQDSCATGEKCVPAKKAKDPFFCAEHCTTSPTTQQGGAQYKNGGCQPQYVIFDVAGTAGITISTGGSACPTGELCAPCQDPLNPGSPSGACY